MLSEFGAPEAGSDPPSGLLLFRRESTAPDISRSGVWSFAACPASVQHEASEPSRDGAQDDFSIPADPPEVGMKR